MPPASIITTSLLPVTNYCNSIFADAFDSIYSYVISRQLRAAARPPLRMMIYFDLAIYFYLAESFASAS